MTSTSCYSMAPAAPGPLITMDVLNTITALPSSIYGPSTVTFVNDTQAYITVDINLTALTKVGWCTPNPLGPFTVNTVTQSQTTFSVA
jgi:hypothetical protein